MKPSGSAWILHRNRAHVAPSSGFARVPNEAEVRATSFLTSIISAPKRLSCSLTRPDAWKFLELEETLSVVAVR